MANDMITAHFARSEFCCKCGCGKNNISAGLVKLLEQVRYMLGGKPVIVSSGCRCESHNEDVGGVPNSKHLHGLACDIVVRGRSPADVCAVISSIPALRAIQYRTFTHVELRQNR